MVGGSVETCIIGYNYAMNYIIIYKSLLSPSFLNVSSLIVKVMDQIHQRQSIHNCSVSI